MDLMEIAGNGITWLGDIVLGFLGYCGSFLLQFYPDADPDIVGTITSWGDALTGYDLTFNVFYFIDINFVVAVLGVAIPCMAACGIYWLVNKTIWLVATVVEMIPFVE